ncbi:MAG TPA: Na-translocating system protein MpsC family protein [Solirubrobacterales bacterium]
MVSIPDRPEYMEGPADPESADERRGPPSAEEVREEVSREILRLYEKSYGKGARQAKAFLGDDYVIVVLDGLELLPNEKFLMEHGKHETVVQVRSHYQHAIQASFRAAIERATGRTVIGFASTTSIDEPRFVAEIFKLD